MTKIEIIAILGSLAITATLVWFAFSPENLSQPMPRDVVAPMRDGGAQQ